jgi:hypothetical protein
MIQIETWERDADDYNGKTQKEIYHVVIGGKKKAVGKADLFKIVKMTLPEGEPDEEELSTNGRQHEAAR